MNTQLKKGVLSLCVLSLLNRRDCYGYEIIQYISNHINISAGTVYPILKKILDDGYAETYLKDSNEGPARKYYTITPSGRRAYEFQTNEWKEFYEAVNVILRGDDNE
ncbi:MAG: PadR family transcriptional regulator [Tissierellia bacterium]|nr:PadR family transcriptional regulator [Tissierellia bacterium]